MRNISDVSFSNDKLRAVTDYFIKDESIAATDVPATAVNGVRLANIQSAVEIVVEVGSVAVNTGSVTALTVKLQKCATKDGTFADVDNGTLAVVAADAAVVPVGTVIGRMTMPVGDDYFYKVVATSAATNAGKITVYQHAVAR